MSSDTSGDGGAAFCQLCGTMPNDSDPSCESLEQALATTDERPFGCPWFRDADRNRHIDRRAAISLRDAAKQMAGALEGAEKWLSGWGSAEPYIAIIREALTAYRAATGAHNGGVK